MNNSGRSGSIMDEFGITQCDASSGLEWRWDGGVAFCLLKISNERWRLIWLHRFRRLNLDRLPPPLPSSIVQPRTLWRSRLLRRSTASSSASAWPWITQNIPVCSPHFAASEGARCAKSHKSLLKTKNYFKINPEKVTKNQKEQMKLTFIVF